MQDAGAGGEEKESEAERQRQRAEQVRREMEANSVRLEPLGLDRRYNRYWRLPCPELEGPVAMEAEAAAAAAEQAAEPAASELLQQQQQQHAGDRLLFESQEDGSISLVASSAALEALVTVLERRGARESGLYASLLRYREQLEAGMPAGEAGWRQRPTGAGATTVH
jgi:hypothetical protein